MLTKPLLLWILLQKKRKKKHYAAKHNTYMTPETLTSDGKLILTKACKPMVLQETTSER
jgi:hypothetical protein